MANCFGPLGGVCAVFSLFAIAILAASAFTGVRFWFADNKQGIVKSMKLGAVGFALLGLVVILSIINNAMLPMSCK